MDVAPTPSLPPANPGEPFWFGLDRKWWVLASVGMGTFMSALNSSVVQTIVPVIMRDLGIDLGTSEWITMVFLVLVSGLLLGFGRLGDLAGHKRVYLVGFLIFVAAAVGCGLAPGAATLIIARGVQAVGSAMILANSPALLTLAFPPRQRGQALGFQGTFTYLGLMTGPAAGGWLSERAGWPSVFFISVPVGLVAMALAWRAVADSPRSPHKERFDFAGSAAFLAGISALLLALSHGQAWGWTSPRVLLLLAGAFAMLVLFVTIERHSASPMIDLSILRPRIIRAATTSAFINYVCLFAVMFLVPFYLFRFRGFSASDAGILLSAQALAMAILAPISGTLSDRIGSRIPASLGMGVLTGGLLLLSTLDAGSSKLEIAARMALLGVGNGLFASPNNSAMMGAAPKGRQGIAAALLASARNVGMVFGIAIGGALFAWFLAKAGGSLDTGAGFIEAFQGTFRVVAVLGVLGIVTALARGDGLPPPTAEARR